MKYAKKIKRVLWMILGANFVVALIKILLGQFIQSASLTADGFHSLTDGTSNIIGLIGIHFASKPMDTEHPYGHKKIENLTSLFISGILLLIGGKIVFDAISRFLSPVTPTISLVSLVMLLLTLSVNIFVAVYEFRQGKKLHSTILISDSIHTKSDIYTSIGVLFTLISVKIGLPPILDPIASLVVAGFILHAAYEIFTSTCGPLLDQAVIPTDQIRELVLTFPEVKDIHEIRSRGREDDIYIDFHIVITPHMNVVECHHLTDAIEKKLAAVFQQTMHIHIRVEPFHMDAVNN